MSSNYDELNALIAAVESKLPRVEASHGWLHHTKVGAHWGLYVSDGIDATLVRLSTASLDSRLESVHMLPTLIEKLHQAEQVRDRRVVDAAEKLREILRGLR